MAGKDEGKPKKSPAKGAGGGSAGLGDVGLLILRLLTGVATVAHAWPLVLAGEVQWAVLGASVDFVGLSADTHGHIGAATAIGLLAGGALLGLGLTTRVATGFVFVLLVASAIRGWMIAPALLLDSPGFLRAINALALACLGGGAFSLDRKPVGR